MAKSYEIQINNWDEYQPRKDLKSLTWVRIQTDIFFSETFFVLDNNQKLLFFYLLTFAGKKNKSAFTLNTSYVASILKLKINEIEQGIEKLESLSILHKSVQIRTDLLPTLHNITNEHNEENKTNITNLVPTSSEVSTAVPNSKTLIKIESPKQLAELLDQKNKNLLFELYADPEFIKREFYKIQNWLDSNPKKNNKTSRGWLQFVANWLDNNWAKYQKNIPANQAKASSVDELMSMMGWS